MDINTERQKTLQRLVLPKSLIKQAERTKDRFKVFHETLGLLGKGDLREAQRDHLSSVAAVLCSNPSLFGATTGGTPEGICLPEYGSSVGISKVLKRTGLF